ncbi:MAG: transposase domain-containing protein [Terriglobia bacterium]
MGRAHRRLVAPDAVIYSILITCRRRGLSPQEYLADVLARLPSAKITQIRALLPANWKSHFVKSSVRLG